MQNVRRNSEINRKKTMAAPLFAGGAVSLALCAVKPPKWLCLWRRACICVPGALACAGDRKNGLRILATSTVLSSLALYLSRSLSPSLSLARSLSLSLSLLPSHPCSASCVVCDLLVCMCVSLPRCFESMPRSHSLRCYIQRLFSLDPSHSPSVYLSPARSSRSASQDLSPCDPFL